MRKLVCMPNKIHIHKKTSAVVKALVMFSPQFVRLTLMELGNAKHLVSFKCKGLKLFPVLSE